MDDLRERARHDAEEDERELILLRECDQNEYRTWASAGMVGHNPTLLCPECKCAKSGYRDDPNPRQERCENIRCRCHEETR